jgi:hypothetical protein
MLLVMHRNMKMHGEGEVWFQAFLTSEWNRGEWSALDQAVLPLVPNHFFWKHGILFLYSVWLIAWYTKLL